MIQLVNKGNFSFKLNKTFKGCWGKTYLHGLHHKSVCSSPHRARHFFKGFPAKYKKPLKKSLDFSNKTWRAPIFVIKTNLLCPEFSHAFSSFSMKGKYWYAIKNKPKIFLYYIFNIILLKKNENQLKFCTTRFDQEIKFEWKKG